MAEQRLLGECETHECQLRRLMREHGQASTASQAELRRLIAEAKQERDDEIRMLELTCEAEDFRQACVRFHVQLHLSPQVPLALDLRKMLPECLVKRWYLMLGIGLLVSAVTSGLVCTWKGWGGSSPYTLAGVSCLLLLLPPGLLLCLQKAGANERNIYYNLVRVRVGYFMCMTLALAFSCFSGTTIETLLGAFSEIFHDDFAVLSLWTLPLQMVLLGMFCEGCITLFFDSAQKAPMIDFLATTLLGMYLIALSWVRIALWVAWFVFIVVGFYGLDHVLYTILLMASFPLVWCVQSCTPSPLESNELELGDGFRGLCKFLDMACFVAVEVAPPFAGYWLGVIWHSDMPDGRGPLGAFFRSYLWTGIVMALWGVAVFLGNSMIVHFLHFGDKRHLGKKRDLHRSWIHTFYKYMVAPGTLSQMYPYIFPGPIDISKSGPEHKKAATKSTDVAFGQLILSVVLALLLAILPGHVFIRHGVLLLFITSSVLFYIAWSRLQWCKSLNSQDDETPLPAAGAAVVSWLIWTWVCWCLKEMSSKHKDVELPLDQVIAALVFVLIWTHTAFKAYFPDLLGRPYKVVVLTFTVVVGLLMWSQNQALALPARAATVVVGAADPRGEHWHLPHLVKEQYSDYGVCQQTFGSRHSSHGLTAIDLSQLAGVVYEQNCSTIEEALPSLFGIRVPRMSNCQGYHEFPRYAVFDFGNDNGNGTRVIAIKGTSTILDALVDATLYSTVKILQFMEYVLPVIDLLPVDQVQWVLWRCHNYGRWEAEEKFWQKLLNTTDHMVQETQRHTLLVGHSLGGSIASVLAARLDLDAVVFSAPGTEYSAVRFGIYQRSYWLQWQKKASAETACDHCGVQLSKDRILNIVPMFDVVPSVDKQLNNEQKIECRFKKQGFRSPFGDTTCHSLKRTACELWRVCGDQIHNRSFNCAEFVSRDTEGLLFEPDDPY